MTRALQLLITLTATLVCASCSHLREAKQRIEYRGLLEDWGANRQKQIWIYQP